MTYYIDREARILSRANLETIYEHLVALDAEYGIPTTESFDEWLAGRLRRKIYILANPNPRAIFAH